MTVSAATRRGPSRKQVLWLAFLIPAAIFLLACLVNGIYPAGKRSLLTVDLYHQYAPFLLEWRRHILSGEFGSFCAGLGLGQNFTALSAYYLGSPFNLLTLLFPPQAICEAVLVIICLKIACLGLSFATLLSRAYCSSGIASVAAVPAGLVRRLDQCAADSAVIACSTAYALSAYVCAYFWNLMWLDGLICLPLIWLGLIELARYGTVARYGLSLAAAITINYYIGLFLCIFSVLSFPVVLISHAPHDRSQRNITRKIFRYAIASFAAGAISAAVTRPAYFAISGSSAYANSLPTRWLTQFSPADLVAALNFAPKPYIRDGLPNIYCGQLILLLIPFYLLNKGIALRERLSHLALLLILLLSLYLNIPNLIWHGLHAPNQLPYRYAFLVPALLALMAFRALAALHAFTPRRRCGTIAMAVTSALAILLPCFSHLYSKELNSTRRLAAILALNLLGLTILYLITHLRDRRAFRLLNQLLCLLLLAELSANTCITINRIGTGETLSARDPYIEGMDQIRDSIRLASERSRLTRTWPRLEIQPQRSSNSPALFGYNGLSVFSTVSPYETSLAMSRLGFRSNGINSYSYGPSTDFQKDFWGLRYLLSREGELQQSGLRLIREKKGERLYENADALPPLFAVGASVEAWRGHEGSPFEQQNELAMLAGAPEAFFEPVRAEFLSAKGLKHEGDSTEATHLRAEEEPDRNGERRASLGLRGPGHFYLYAVADEDFQINIRRQGVQQTGGRTAVQQSAGNSEKPKGERDIRFRRGELIDCGAVDENIFLQIDVHGKLDAGRSVHLYVCRYNRSAYEKALSRWQAGAARNLRVDSQSFEADVTLGPEQAIFLTTPYDLGWQVTVDGEPRPLLRMAQGFCGVRADPGIHHVRFFYRARGLTEGILISAAGLCMMILLIALTARTPKGRLRCPPQCKIMTDCPRKREKKRDFQRISMNFRDERRKSLDSSSSPH